MRISKVCVLIGFLTSICQAENPSCAANVRLPTSLNPLHYDLLLSPTLSGNFDVKGHVNLDVEVKEKTDSITLHTEGIDVHNTTVKVVQKDNKVEYEIMRQTYDVERTFFIVKLHRIMLAGKNYSISMHFNTTLNDKTEGFYRSSYLTEEGERSWVASTHFEATHPRKSFPCLDEPGFKSTFTITICRDQDKTSLSNMPLDYSTTIGGTRLVCDHFKESVPMSTYLVAYAVSDYKPTVIATPEGITKIKVWTRPAVMDQAQYGGEVAKKCLIFFEDLFDMKYPLPKLDLIVPPDMNSNAMENWGLITYRESGILYDDVTSSAKQHQWVSSLTCHELSHQWFGNIVTPKWWNDLWLNEGFATFIAPYALSKVYPDLGTMENFVVETLQAAMALDVLSSSHPISVEVNDPAEINDLFDAISYKKGASVIRMMENFLTHETFVSGLREYFKKFAYANTAQDDLWHFLNAAQERSQNRLPEGLTVKEIMDTWTLKKGFPVLTVKRSYGPRKRSANISQELFSFDRSVAKNSTKLWWIPITKISKGQKVTNEPKIKAWLGKKEGELYDMPHADSWLIVNVLQTGYYRVNYDETNWDLIHQQLQLNHTVIDVTNRAQIIDDALNLARAGLLSYKTALKVTSYLNREHHFVPWRAAIEGFSYLLDMFRHTPNYGPLQEYILSMIIPVYRHLGLKDKQDDTSHTKFLRGMVFDAACFLGHKDCVNDAKKIYDQWKADPEDFWVPSNLGETVFCSVMRRADREEWEWAWEKYVLATDQTLRGAMRKGFCCSKEIWMLERYLSMATDRTQKSGIRQSDIADIFEGIAGNSVGDMVAWNYFWNNWDNINEYLGSAAFALPKMLISVTKHLNTKMHLSEVIELRENNKHPSSKRGLDQAVEATKNNMLWMENNYKSNVDWLKKKGKGFTSTLPTIESLNEKDDCDTIE